MHPIILSSSVFGQTEAHLNAEEFLLTRTRGVCRCIEQCSKPHCACARLQGMRLFLENDVILK